MKTSILLAAACLMALPGCRQDSSCMKPGETGRIVQISTDDTRRIGLDSRIETIRFAMGKNDEIRLCEGFQSEATKMLKVGDSLHVRNMTDVTP